MYGRSSAGLIILLVIGVGMIYLFISSWLKETKRQKMEKQGEPFQEDNFRDYHDL